MCGPLCATVTGRQDAAALLEALERSNFFVVPLDDQRHWYRYHHLFAGVLRARLLAEQPDHVATLHRRTSLWYEQDDSPPDAILHALAAGDVARAADLIERAVPALRRSRQDATLLGWLKAFPDEVIRVRPVLSVAYAWALLAGGDLDAVEARLRDAERWLVVAADMADTGGQPHAPSAEMVVVDDEEFRRLPAAIAVYRAAHALALGDVVATMTYANRALDLVPEDDDLGRGAATALLGLASWVSGDLETAHRAFSDGMTRVRRAGNLSDVVNGTIALADIRVAQGRLRDAMRTYERSLRLAAELEGPDLRGMADLYVGMSELHREHDDLPAAIQLLQRSQELSERTGLPQNRSRWCVAMARIHEAQGDLDGTLDLLHEAARLYVGDLFPTVRPVVAVIARVWIAQGRLDDALRWAHEQRLFASDDLSYLREFEHITLARVLVARYQFDRTGGSLHEALDLLQRLLRAAEAGARIGNVIEILMLQALAYHTRGDLPAALVPLQRALTLAEPEGYFRLFVDEGSAMVSLLRAAAVRAIMPEYAGRLLGAYDAGHPDRNSIAGQPSTPASPAASALPEPLTQRELEVLRLFTTDLSGPEIADTLVIALSTLRTHTKSIYSKLNVANRRAAVKRATELHLL
jgi:LuxR family maltose regulon positive regulatory protein